MVHCPVLKNVTASFQHFPVYCRMSFLAMSCTVANAKCLSSSLNDLENTDLKHNIPANERPKKKKLSLLDNACVYA